MQRGTQSGPFCIGNSARLFLHCHTHGTYRNSTTLVLKGIMTSIVQACHPVQQHCQDHSQKCYKQDPCDPCQTQTHCCKK
ncbi:uncharacterized protein LOC128639845 isoform X4 [Bombina bombina]|uniref:uncharacterized protein LOC128639845 isoform X4 n=1 Tax=Bombina bombina TaxID=8345 RepID=UPI00235AADB6|nr:uncharacterized protein LOC128639845 isoform X4 [Bombina bombina]